MNVFHLLGLLRIKLKTTVASVHNVAFLISNPVSRQYWSNLAPTSAARSSKRGSVTFFTGASVLLLQASLTIMLSLVVDLTYRPFRTRHRKCVSECLCRLKFPSNEERECQKCKTMKLSMHASGFQCHGTKSPPILSSCTRFLERVFSRWQKQAKISPGVVKPCSRLKQLSLSCGPYRFYLKYPWGLPRACQILYPNQRPRLESFFGLLDPVFQVFFSSSQLAAHLAIASLMVFIKVVSS